MIDSKAIIDFVKIAFEQDVDLNAVLIDARSPGEYAHAHIPGSVNVPLLDDTQREQVGTCYKNQGRQEAIDLGFALAGPGFLEKIQAARRAAEGRPVAVYCARGGLRSEILTWLLNKGGLTATQLRGGYKQWRNACLSQFRSPRKWYVLTGLTGVGKTELLFGLKDAGEAVLDFECIAQHRGSAFGGLGMPVQPTQEQFENILAVHLDANSEFPHVWMEDESRFIGKLRIPDDLYEAKINAQRIMAERSFESRVKRVLAEYGALCKISLAEKTASLEKRMGNELMRQALTHLEQNEMEAWAGILLTYYDRHYQHGIGKNSATCIGTVSTDQKTNTQIVQEIIALTKHGE